jgi:hypothetical protein
MHLFLSKCSQNGKPHVNPESGYIEDASTVTRNNNIKDRYHFMGKQNEEKGRNNIKFYIINQVCCCCCCCCC